MVKSVVVIGAGPGGYVAAIRAAQLGFAVTCIDKNWIGGTCLNVGCIPSKSLLYATESYDFIHNKASQVGISAAEVSFNFPTMMKNKENVIKGLVDGVASHFKKYNIEYVQGAAKFISPNTLEVNGKTLSADAFIIATGSEPIELPFLPFDEKKIVSSTGALSLTQVPDRFVVIGGGVIGVEIASIYKRLGSEVTIIEMLDTILPSMDSAIRRGVLQILKKQGIEFILSAKVTKAQENGQATELSFEQDGKAQKIIGDVVMVCVGRRPLTKGLQLENANVKVDGKGFVQISKDFRTTSSHPIYAIGDVVDGPMLAHKASREGIVVAEHLAGLMSKVNYMTIPNVVYTHPEVATVGLTEEEVKAAGMVPAVGTVYFKGNPRGRCSGEIDGFVKVVGDKKGGRLLGVHIIGSHASELIAEGVVALEKRATLLDIADACHAHPTLSESVMEACQQAIGKSIHA